jgi:hypothetical protein
MERPLRDVSSALRHADKNGVAGTEAQKNNRRAGDTITMTVGVSIRRKYWAKLEKLRERQSSSRKKDQRCCQSVTRAVWGVIENANCRRAGSTVEA